MHVVQTQLLKGVERDLAPFSQGVTLQMVEQVYCRDTAHVTSFRVQVGLVGLCQSHQRHKYLLVGFHLLGKLAALLPLPLNGLPFCVTGALTTPSGLQKLPACFNKFWLLQGSCSQRMRSCKLLTGSIRLSSQTQKGKLLLSENGTKWHRSNAA